MSDTNSGDKHRGVGLASPVTGLPETRSRSLTFTAIEVADLLGVARNTIYTAAERGQIPGAIRIGRRLLFARATVLAWLGQGASSEE